MAKGNIFLSGSTSAALGKCKKKKKKKIKNTPANGKIKEETYATEQGVGKATGRARRSLSWLVTWS